MLITLVCTDTWLDCLDFLVVVSVSELTNTNLGWDYPMSLFHSDTPPVIVKYDHQTLL